MARAVEDGVPLADSIAWSFFTKVPYGELDEFKSIAREALTRAASHWVSPYCESRGYNPWSEADPSKPEKHFSDGGGYAARVIKGALLDWARRQDHCTRSTRSKIKQIQAAQDDGAKTEAELAAATGIPAEKIREVLAADAARPVSLDWHDDVNGEYAGAALADEGADVEAQAGLNDLTRVFLAAYDALDAETRVILALRYGELELDFTKIAELMFTSLERILKLHERGVLEVHAALVRSAETEGTGSRTRTPAFRIRSSDSCQAAELAAVIPGKRCNGECGRVLPPEEFSWRSREKGYRVPYCPPCDRARQRARHAARLARAGR